MIKVVIDTNIFVSAHLTPKGIPAQVVELFVKGKLQLFYSEQMLAEYNEVLYRPKFCFSPQKIAIVLTSVTRFGNQITVAPSVIPLPDETDRKFYDASQASGAYLITGNLQHYPQSGFVVSPKTFIDTVCGEENDTADSHRRLL